MNDYMERLSKFKDGSFRSFHDGQLYGIAMDSSDLVISVESIAGVRESIVASDILDLVATNFMAGNIILECEVFRCPSDDDLQSFVSFCEKRFDEIGSPMHALEENISEQHLLLTIQATWGCQLAAICSSCTVSEG